MVASCHDSFYNDVVQAAPVEVFQMNKAFQDDQFAKKVSLGIGAYRDDDGKPWILPAVRQAEKAMVQDDTLNHEYLPILGFESFTQAAVKLLLGENHEAILQRRAFGVQGLSGTGSLRLGLEFLFKTLGYRTVYLSSPTWENHHLILKMIGFEADNIKEYSYWDNINKCVDFTRMMADIEAAADKSIVILHGCAHNPTGIDLSHDQWIQLCQLVKKKRLFPFFDLAYQGFASGDPDEDAWSVRHFAKENLEMMVAQSFAKNFGLYNERVGNLTVILNEEKLANPVKSQLTLLVRANWSNPPAHGARIIYKILSDPNLKSMWFDHIKVMSGRIKAMRQALREKLEKLNTPGTWNHITDQIGMFSFTGLSPKQVELLINKYHIYLLKNGRISVAGLNTKNIDYVAQAIFDAVSNC